MMRSLFSGVAGLRNHQTRMDTVGNNIANVNTTGFKAGRAQFQDMLSQTLQGAAGPNGTMGGTNPMQVGLGMSIASMDSQFTDGALQSTGVPTDLAISGDGFFVLSNGSSKLYTRDGSFKFDQAGNYVVPGTGMKVQGWMADASGVINTAGVVTDIVKPSGVTIPAKQSTSATFTGNLNSATPNGGSAASSQNIYDSLGNTHLLTQQYYKVNVGTGNNTWICKSDVSNISSTPPITNQYTQVSFNTDGTLNKIQTLTPPAAVVLPPATTQNLTITGLGLNTTGGSTNAYAISTLDSAGVAHPITATFTNLTATTWSLQFSDASGNLGAASTVTYTPPTTYSGLPASFTYSGTGGVTNTVNVALAGSIAAGAGVNAGTTACVNPGAAAQSVTLSNFKLSTSTDPQVIAFSEFDNSGALRTFKGTFTYNASTTSWSCAVSESGDLTNTTLATIPNITWNGTNYLSNGATFPNGVTIPYQSKGVPSSPNVITITPLLPANVAAPDGTAMTTIASEPNGITPSTTESTLSFSVPGANAMTIAFDRSKITQSKDVASSINMTPDGYAMGTLTSVTFDTRGVMTGLFSNNLKKQLGQVAMANFANNNGLMKAGNNTYQESNNSGLAKVGEANTGGRGALTPASLEMSNVDLSQEFSNMIITQRGFQANSKIITTSDTMLEELVNLKR